ncbi:sulfonate ABC transporter substrate-binding protein [Leptolyngbya sp. FACHB-321]|uniref:sulfonate ABC transporter substrate-binding protein n=1 Tax=Leptolyngbya sp. FACHB-321 TaxID=2692807 RepID=UPI001F552C11|nr:sulfonate ABC transporter substrate-binding protein [Leptolyngbya sp. FACHB-321]
MRLWQKVSVWWQRIGRLQRSLPVLPMLFVIALVLTLTTAACSQTATTTSADSTSTASAAPVVLRIGRQKFDPLTLVRAKGKLEERLKPLGITAVEWIEFQSGPPMLEALNADSIDIARTGDAPPVIAQAAGVPLVYVGGSAPKDKSSAVLVKQDSPIQAIADLRGKKVAFAKSSSANYLAVKALEAGGLKWEDIKPVYLSPSDARSAFEQGNVDAWVIWDPFYAAAQKQAGARVVRDSAGLVANRDFYLATRKFADKYPDVIKAIGEEVQAVAKWADANPSEVAALLSPLLKIDQPILETVNQRRNYGFEAITPEMIAEQQAIADTFHTLKLIPKPIDVKNAIWKAV